MTKLIWAFRIVAVLLLLVGGAVWFLGPRGDDGAPNPWVMRSIAAFLVLYMIASAINVSRQFLSLKRPSRELERTSTALTRRPEDEPPPPPTRS